MQSNARAWEGTVRMFPLAGIKSGIPLAHGAINSKPHWTPFREKHIGVVANRGEIGSVPYPIMVALSLTDCGRATTLLFITRHAAYGIIVTFPHYY